MTINYQHGKQHAIADMVSSNAVENEEQAKIYFANLERIAALNSELANDENFQNWIYQQPEMYEVNCDVQQFLNNPKYL